MGNCFRRIRDGDDSDLDTYYPHSSYGGHAGGGYPSRPSPVTFTVVGYTAFVRDLVEFETTNEVPEALSRYVSASKATQRLWFLRLLNAWRRANPAPTSEETVAVLLIQTLQDCSDIQGLLRFYHLPWPTVSAAKPVPAPATQPVPVPTGKPVPAEKPVPAGKPVPVPTGKPVPAWKPVPAEKPVPAGKPVLAGKPVPAGRPLPADKPAPRKPEAQVPTGKQKRKPAVHAPAGKKKKKPAAHATAGQPDQEKPKASQTWLVTPEAAEEIEYEIHTLPVNWDKVKDKIYWDGDGFTVFVNVFTDAREAGLVPKAVQEAALSRHKARAQKNYKMADALQKKIEAAEYKVFDRKNDGTWCLARKYDIRLRGVDAPEIKQPYGVEARDVLRSLVKDQQLLIRVYNTDKYERKVGDIYCNGMFIQEVLLKKGSVWHYEHFDKRETFAEWHRAAKEACIGLWADPNPEAPWDFKKRVKKEKKEGSFRIGGA